MSSKTLTIALVLGLVAAGGSYYVWCSLQWRDAAATKRAEASASVEASAAAYEGAPSGYAQTAAAPVAAARPGANALAVNPTTTAVAAAPVFASTLALPGTVAVDARLGQGAVLPGRESRLHLLVSATASSTATGERPPANLVLVLDRSGSMKGERIDHARAAAKFLVNELRDGDRVSIVSYNTAATVDQESITLTAANRRLVLDAIDDIKIGGDTCISCGLDQGRQQMLVGRSSFASLGQDPTSRIVLLSDGKATAGLRDTGSLAQRAAAARGDGAPVTTIGLGLGYNEELMTELARQGTGNHYFVEAPEALSGTLAAELETLRNVVARQAVATLQLTPGTRLIKVFDREAESFGDTVTIDLGDLSRGAESTVLAELAVIPGGLEGSQAISSVTVSYLDTTTGALEHANGMLGATVTTNPAEVQASRDQEVEARIEQAAIRDALEQANALARAGEVDKARDVIQQQATESRGWRKRKKVSSKRAARSFKALEEAEASFNAPMKDDADLQRNLKSNSGRAFDLAL